jgi:ribosomal protein S7
MEGQKMSALTIVQTALDLIDTIIEAAQQKQIAEIMQDSEKLKREIVGFAALAQVWEKRSQKQQEKIKALQDEINNMKELSHG